MIEFRISKHAKEQMEEREITEDMVKDIIKNPDQEFPQGDEKHIYQSIKEFKTDKKSYLVRVFVNIVKIPWLVITVYKTSRIKKYWKNEDKI
ncbi:MAG: DUF4258 domain-containing protein [Saprospiraceae bacterium]